MLLVVELVELGRAPIGLTRGARSVGVGSRRAQVKGELVVGVGSYAPLGEVKVVVSAGGVVVDLSRGLNLSGDLDTDVFQPRLEVVHYLLVYRLGRESHDAQFERVTRRVQTDAVRARCVAGVIQKFVGLLRVEGKGRGIGDPLVERVRRGDLPSCAGSQAVENLSQQGVVVDRPNDCPAQNGIVEGGIAVTHGLAGCVNRARV